MTSNERTVLDSLAKSLEFLESIASDPLSLSSESFSEDSDLVFSGEGGTVPSHFCSHKRTHSNEKFVSLHSGTSQHRMYSSSSKGHRSDSPEKVMAALDEILKTSNRSKAKSIRFNHQAGQSMEEFNFHDYSPTSVKRNHKGTNVSARPHGKHPVSGQSDGELDHKKRLLRASGTPDERMLVAGGPLQRLKGLSAQLDEQTNSPQHYISTAHCAGLSPQNRRQGSASKGGINAPQVSWDTDDACSLNGSTPGIRKKRASQHTRLHAHDLSPTAKDSEASFGLCSGGSHEAAWSVRRDGDKTPKLISSDAKALEDMQEMALTPFIRQERANGCAGVPDDVHAELQMSVDIMCAAVNSMLSAGDDDNDDGGSDDAELRLQEERDHQVRRCAEIRMILTYLPMVCVCLKHGVSGAGSLRNAVLRWRSEQGSCLRTWMCTIG
jgi:hypothetical protein